MSRRSSLIAYVRSLGDYLTLAEVSRVLGIPRTTFQKLAAEEPAKYGPSETARYGGLPVYLYTLRDVTRCETNLSLREPSTKGRPRLFTPEQSRLRQRAYMRAYYYTSRAATLTEAGNGAKAAEALSKAQKIYAQLAEERRLITSG